MFKTIVLADLFPWHLSNITKANSRKILLLAFVIYETPDYETIITWADIELRNYFS